MKTIIEIETNFEFDIKNRPEENISITQSEKELHNAIKDQIKERIKSYLDFFIEALKQHANKFNYIIETHIENQKSLEKYDGVKIKIK